MNEVEYILRIVLKARDELAGALKRAREELRLFANAADSNKAKIDGFNTSIEKMNTNVSNITDKFKEWREVIQGTAGGNDKAKKSFADLGREVDTTNKATQRHAEGQARAARAQDALLKSADKLRNEYRKLSAQEQQSDKDRQYTLFRLQAIGRELETLSKKVDDPAIRRFYFNWAQDSKRAADSIINDTRRVEEAHKQLAKSEEEAATKRQRVRDRDAAARAAFQRTFAVRERLSGKDSDFIDIGEAKQVVTVLRQVAKGYDDSSKTARRLRGEAEQLSAEIRGTGRSADSTKSFFTNLRESFAKNQESAAGLDNTLRGIGWLAAAGFAQQLITVLGGLAGALTAVAGSAAEAGAAIGGMLAAGAAQAAPVVGLLGAAMFQVKGALDAVKAAQLARQQAFTQGADADKRTADAADTVKNAQESAANAQRQLMEAQENLTKARRDGRRELQDLIRAENDAKLAAAGAALSQKEAQQALIAAQSRGDVSGIQRAQLQVLQAQADATDALTQKRRAAADAERGRRGGVEGLDSVVQARRALEDAERSVTKANRGIDTAKRNAAEAAAGADTAASKLQFLLSQMTRGQVALFHAMEDLRKAYQRDFGPISDIILGSFTRAVRGITRILQSPQLLGTARRLATQISRQLDRIFDSFTDQKTLGQFYRFANEARKNLKPVTDIVITLGHAFLNIAEESGPAFRRFLIFVRGLADQFGRLVGHRRSMEQFFLEGEKHFESWINLGIAVIRLFAALTGAGGAESGLRTIEDATKAVDDLTKKVNANKGDVADFFEGARKIAYQVVEVIAVLAEELAGAFTPERIQDFAELLKTVVIPALGDAVAFMGHFTSFILKIADTPFGKHMVQFGIATFFVMKILGSTLSLVTGFVGALGNIVRPFVLLARQVPFVQRLVGGIRLLLGEMRVLSLLRFAAFGAGFFAIGAAVVFLLAKLGLLDDAWRAVKSGFNAFWKEVRPALGRLIKAFGDLWDAVSQGRGLFSALGAVLRPVLKVIIDIGAIFLRVFGRTLGRIIGGVIDVLAGLITFLTGVFTGDWRKAWSGIRLIFRGIFRALTAPLRALPELIAEIARKVVPAFKKGISGLWDFLEDMPSRLSKLASRAGSAFVKGLVGALKSSGGVARDIANAFIDLLNWMLPNKIPVPGAPDINLPNNPIPHLAGGGPVPGSGRGDRVHALLEPGEHVLTRQEVAALGGHGAVFALRRALGGGGQGSGGRLQQGGAAGAGGLTITFQGGSLDDFRSAWRQFWNVLVVSARQGANLVEDQFHDMRVNTSREVNRMYLNVRGSIADMQNSFKVRGDRIINSWTDMWDSIKKVTHEGLFYIGHETNKALTGLGEKHIDFGLSAPQKSDGKAGGGWIGSQGQRGRDRGFYPLGAGEAVLNWQHQRYVEPAMNAYYGHGLSTMFDRVHGYHAGGAEQRGFAGGRAGVAALFDGHPSNVVSGIIELVRILKKKFPGLLVTSTRDHGAITSTGGISDHPSGHAVDIASADYSIMDRATAYIKSSGIAKKLKQGIHNPGLAINQGKNVGAGFFAGAWPQHLNHIHLAMAGALGRVADMITNIAKQVVEGPDGGLKTIMQSALDTVRKAANKLIDDKSAAGADVAGLPGGPGTPAPKGQHRKWIIAGLRLAGVPITEGNISAQYTLDMGESGGVAKIVQQVHDINSVTGNLARGIAQVIPPTFNTYKVPGHGNIDNPVDNIAASAKYQIARYGHLVGHSGYARGGEIPGQPGAPVPILAHAREWILNEMQQGRLASLLGTSRDALRSMLGFHGPGHTAQGGTEVDTESITPLTAGQVRGISDRRLRRLIRALRLIGENIDKAATGIGSVESWSRYIDNSMASLRRVTRRVSRRTEGRRNVERGVLGFLDAMEKLTGEEGVFARLRASIERRAARLGRRIVTDRLLRGAGGVVTERLDEAQVARRELAEQRRQGRDLRGERADIRGALRLTRRQLRRRGLSDDARQRLITQRQQLRASLEEADQRVADNLSAVFDAQQAYIDAQKQAQQDITDAITKRYEDALAGVDLFRRVGTALGNESIIDQVNRTQRDLLTRQMNELQARVAPARAAGAGELADQIQAQVNDLRVQIFESIQQELHDAVERVNARAQRRLGRLDLANRLLDAVGAVGLGTVASLAGERFSRAGIFAQRGQALAAQRTGLQGVLRGAQAQGNVALIQELTDQLAELDVTIKENTKAAFDARTEEINNRSALAIQQSDLRAQIITLTGEISGNTDTAALLTEAQNKATALQEQRTGLLAQLAIAQQQGNTAAVNDLTTQLLENQLALLQNTQATTQLTGQLSGDQGFTSTAFELFSQAIFTGSGGLLPMYQALFPSAQVGANVLGSGMLMAHAGEKIVPAKVAALSGAGSMGDTNYFDIDINEAGRPIDWAGAATQIMFKKSGAK